MPELWDGTEDTFYDESDDSSALVETSDTEAEVSKVCTFMCTLLALVFGCCLCWRDRS